MFIIIWPTCQKNEISEQIRTTFPKYDMNEIFTAKQILAKYLKGRKFCTNLMSRFIKFQKKISENFRFFLIKLKGWSKKTSLKI